MRWIVNIAILLMVSTSCVTHKRCMEKYGGITDTVIARQGTQRVDTVEVLRYGDTISRVLTVPGDLPEWIWEILPRQDTLILGSSRSLLTIDSNREYLHRLEVQNDTVGIPVFSTDSLTTRTITKYLDKQVKFIPAFYRFTFWFFWTVILMSLIYIVVRYGGRLKSLFS